MNRVAVDEQSIIAEALMDGGPPWRQKTITKQVCRMPFSKRFVRANFFNSSSLFRYFSGFFHQQAINVESSQRPWCRNYAIWCGYCGGKS
jgi:hypothetical protein